MSDSDSAPQDSAGEGPGQPVRQEHLSARVPEGVGSGVFSTGVIVMSGATEFVLDFVQSLGQPRQIVDQARGKYWIAHLFRVDEARSDPIFFQS